MKGSTFLVSMEIQTLCLVFALAVATAATQNNVNKIIGNTPGKKVASGAVAHFEPQITTICPQTPQSPNKILNSYMSENGEWTTDPSTTCLKTKLEILKYCQRIYKNRDINNIVESTHITQVNVCVESGEATGYNGKCNGNMVEKWVKPYRCLESPFQSDALLVPSPCLFDHIHNSTLCVNSDQWNNTALASCNAKGMYLKSYAVLLPCGISLFTGVEFVCCPETVAKVSSVKKIDYAEDEDEDEDEEEDEEEEEEEEYEDKQTTTTTTTPKPTIDPYFQNFNILNEHQNYIEAKERLNKLHKTRINGIMSDWNKLEDRYQAMRTNDPVGAEDFKRTVTMRFQKTVKALEDESLAEKKQLISIHGQRILSHLNEKKREAMECYTKALNERPQVSRKVRKCMEKLMKYLNKDRHHTILYFKNNLNNEDIYEYTLDRLEQITNTAKESLGMLGRYIHLSSELKPLIEDYILSLQGSSDLKYNSILSATRESDGLFLNEISGRVSSIGTTTTVTVATTVETTSEKLAPSTATQTTEKEIEAKLYGHDEMGFVANAKVDRVEHREATFTVRREVYYSNENRNLYVIMAFAGFALFGTLVIGVVVLRRRNSPRNQGFLEVNTASQPLDSTLKSPEEKHVVNMQINGYENPTYKYFEVK